MAQAVSPLLSRDRTMETVPLLPSQHRQLVFHCECPKVVMPDLKGASRPGTGKQSQGSKNRQPTHVATATWLHSHSKDGFHPQKNIGFASRIVCHTPRMTTDIRERLDTFIKRKGLRHTPQRNAIVEIIFASDEHFTPDELWERLRGTDAQTSRATLYRTLALLTEAGLLQEIDLGDGQATFDPNFLNKPSHNHLVCVDCGEVIEFEDEHLEVLNECITRRLGFNPVKQSLRIEACCEELRSSKRCPNLIQARLERKRFPGKKR